MLSEVHKHHPRHIRCLPLCLTPYLCTACTVIYWIFFGVFVFTSVDDIWLNAFGINVTSFVQPRNKIRNLYLYFLSTWTNIWAVSSIFLLNGLMYNVSSRINAVNLLSEVNDFTHIQIFDATVKNKSDQL